MVQALKFVGNTLIALAILDLMVVMTAMLQIANGVYTPHIPFWDAQMRLLINLIT